MEKYSRRDFGWECAKLTALVLVSSCSGGPGLSSPEPVVTSSRTLPQVPIDPKKVGAVLVSGKAIIGDTLFGTLERLNWSPIGKDVRSTDTTTGKSFSGFEVISLFGITPEYGIVLAVNGGHFFYDSVNDLDIPANSTVVAYYGLPCSNASTC